MQKIIPFLWFDGQAEEAANFYVSVFESSPHHRGPSSVGRISRFGKEGFEFHGQKEGTVMVVEFTLDGQQFQAINGGPLFKFTEATSFLIPCQDQKEIDYFSDTLSAQKDAEQCGWIKDRYGLSWQIVPTLLDTLMSDPDMIRSGRVMKAMLQMKRIDISAIQKAYDGV